ncbi:DMT family transporter [Cognaticolwellia mytili]|uniref:DMT family transporter n=1 Tax=Cognaticolwellia mytili TaxID=1888913 RepID=UPI000A16EA8F|nr:DMT family transporter [Cognaticolwellia mytili]
MPVSVAYLAVVIIWSTTPLGIVWSSETVSPTLAVLLRMLIAIVPGMIILKLANINLPWSAQARKIYTYSCVGVFGGMLFAYFAAQYLASGMMSLIFGLSPILSGVLAQKILGEPKFSMAKKLALALALLGLFVVCSDSMSLNDNSVIGIASILLAVFFFSISGVLVKSVNIEIHPLATTVGALTFSVPLFAIVWFLVDGTLPYQEWHARSIWAILYLGILGSLVGFLAYFFILQRLRASTVALITMMTPIFALYLGAVLNNETVSFNLVFGALLVMCGLALYQRSGKLAYLKEKSA